jgi:hypothetical protein
MTPDVRSVIPLPDDRTTGRIDGPGRFPGNRPRRPRTGSCSSWRNCSGGADHDDVPGGDSEGDVDPRPGDDDLAGGGLVADDVMVVACVDDSVGCWADVLMGNGLVVVGVKLGMGWRRNKGRLPRCDRESLPMNSEMPT